MGESDILYQLIKLFEKFNLPYLLTGGYAVSYYGKPRATNDIDFLVELTQDNQQALLQIVDNLSSEYIFDKRAISLLKDKKTEFNLVHSQTGIKVDFWIIPKNEFYQQYQRRQVKKVGRGLVSLTSPEDLILTKLRWCKQIFSERHFDDCVGIIHLQKDKLDLPYLQQKARKSGITHFLKDILQITKTTNFT